MPASPAAKKPATDGEVAVSPVGGDISDQSMLDNLRKDDEAQDDSQKEADEGGAPEAANPWQLSEAVEELCAGRDREAVIVLRRQQTVEGLLRSLQDDVPRVLTSSRLSIAICVQVAEQLCRIARDTAQEDADVMEAGARTALSVIEDDTVQLLTSCRPPALLAFAERYSRAPVHLPSMTQAVMAATKRLATEGALEPEHVATCINFLIKLRVVDTAVWDATMAAFPMDLSNVFPRTCVPLLSALNRIYPANMGEPGSFQVAMLCPPDPASPHAHVLPPVADGHLVARCQRHLIREREIKRFEGGLLHAVLGAASFAATSGEMPPSTWWVWRQGAGRLRLSDVDPHVATQVLVAMVVLTWHDPNFRAGGLAANLVAAAVDTWAQEDTIGQLPIGHVATCLWATVALDLGNEPLVAALSGLIVREASAQSSQEGVEGRVSNNLPRHLTPHQATVALLALRVAYCGRDDVARAGQDPNAWKQFLGSYRALLQGGRLLEAARSQSGGEQQARQPQKHNAKVYWVWDEEGAQFCRSQRSYRALSAGVKRAARWSTEPHVFAGQLVQHLRQAGADAVGAERAAMCVESARLLHAAGCDQELQWLEGVAVEQGA